MTAFMMRRRLLAGLSATGLLGLGVPRAGAQPRQRIVILGAGLAGLSAARALHDAAPGSQLWIEPGFGHAEGAISDDLVRRIGAWATRR